MRVTGDEHGLAEQHKHVDDAGQRLRFARARQTFDEHILGSGYRTSDGALLDAVEVAQFKARFGSKGFRDGVFEQRTRPFDDNSSEAIGVLSIVEQRAEIGQVHADEALRVDVVQDEYTFRVHSDEVSENGKRILDLH